jgi:hypothetical protein
LCYRCYQSADVRQHYPRSESKYARNGVGQGCRGYQLPEPTDARPGSAEKVAVLEERARLGLALWHPLDAVAGDD